MLSPKMLYEWSVPLAILVEATVLDTFLHDITKSVDGHYSATEIRKKMSLVPYTPVKAEDDWHLHPSIENLKATIHNDFHMFISNGARKFVENRGGSYIEEKDVSAFCDILKSIESFAPINIIIDSLAGTHVPRDAYIISKAEAGEDTIKTDISKMRNRFKSIIFGYFKIYEDLKMPIDLIFAFHTKMAFEIQENITTNGCQLVHNIMDLRHLLVDDQLTLRVELLKIFHWNFINARHNVSDKFREYKIMFAERLVKFHVLRFYPKSEECINRMMPEFPQFEVTNGYNQKVKYLNLVDDGEGLSYFYNDNAQTYIVRILNLRNNDKSTTAYEHKDIDELVKKYIDKPYIAMIKAMEDQTKKLMDALDLNAKTSKRLEETKDPLKLKINQERPAFASWVNQSVSNSMTDLDNQSAVAHTHVHDYNENPTEKVVIFKQIEEAKFNKIECVKDEKTNEYYGAYLELSALAVPLSKELAKKRNSKAFDKANKENLEVISDSDDDGMINSLTGGKASKGKMIRIMHQEISTLKTSRRKRSDIREVNVISLCRLNWISVLNFQSFGKYFIIN